ncbi:hypothetical protein TorRG33x02_003930 [Trema orientale]|uniref:Embryo defective n=1 Tax=Trema orientale TaxID=63057 RepID=A0A2P5G245_TREOI|nr:hypothetical protein TorRG33x02_003930 [Trema orientale]
MSLRLHCPFLGVPLHGSSSSGRKVGNFIYLDGGQFSKRRCRRSRCFCAKQNHWVTQVIRFSHFCGQNVELLKTTLGSRYGMKVKCVEERLTRSKALVSSLSPLWKEGLLFVRCSVFVAVISGVCLLVWYGQAKAKGFVEAKLLPSVCSSLSEYIEREIDFGKVRSVSPLSITLESCSVGPQNEEFSCGEVPKLKIRLCPFASLRRGRIVVDAVLSHPNVLVVQKKDYSWLGIPSSGDGLQRHLSTEEGIDYRTKTRRIAREEAATCWARERDEAAKNAAEMGYIVPDKGTCQFRGDDLKESDSQLVKFTSLDSFLCMDEKMHLRDHHCLDTGVDYNMKHADLEKSFGVKVPGSGLKFWSKVIQGPKRHNFKKKANGGDISASSITAKRRILGRSAMAAAAYFQGLSPGKSCELSESSGGYDVTNLDTLLVKNEVDTNGGTSITNVAESNANCFMESEDLGGDVVNVSTSDEILENQRSLASPNSTSINLDTHLSTNHPVLVWPLSLKSSLPTFSRKMKELLSRYFSGPIQKLTSGMGPRVEDIVAELVDGADTPQGEGIEKMLPVTLDSVHFKGGTLMLLAYGDKEPREMENVNGHVKFQNHYGRVHVQLSGNCKMWRSDLLSEDGGWLSADVFVDIVEQKWHANLKIVNLFAPLFERILEIPIEWSKGRATGEVHMCMSLGETFPNLHGQLDVTGLAFQIFDAPSGFSTLATIQLCLDRFTLPQCQEQQPVLQEVPQANQEKPANIPPAVQPPIQHQEPRNFDGDSSDEEVERLAEGHNFWPYQCGQPQCQPKYYRNHTKDYKMKIDLPYSGGHLHIEDFWIGYSKQRTSSILCWFL